jgi:hypothetical protein
MEAGDSPSDLGPVLGPARSNAGPEDIAAWTRGLGGGRIEQGTSFVCVNGMPEIFGQIEDPFRVATDVADASLRRRLVGG